MYGENMKKDKKKLHWGTIVLGAVFKAVTLGAAATAIFFIIPWSISVLAIFTPIAWGTLVGMSVQMDKEDLEPSTRYGKVEQKFIKGMKKMLSPITKHAEERRLLKKQAKIEKNAKVEVADEALQSQLKEQVFDPMQKYIQPDQSVPIMKQNQGVELEQRK